MKRAFSAAILVAMVLGCGGGDAIFQEVAPAPRRLVVWLEDGSLDADLASRMRNAGVDEVVVRLGGVDLAGQLPVVRFDDQVAVEGPVPVGIVIEVRGIRDGLDRNAAEAVWRSLDAELDGRTPAEIILDIPRLADGLDEFVTGLIEVSGVSVAPLLSFEQLRSDRAREVAQAARVCVIPAFGTDAADLRGIGELDPLPLDKKLESLAGSGVRVRLAVVLTPRTDPPLESAGEDLNPITEGRVTTVSTTSTLDRTFTFERAASWSGQGWTAGDSVAVRWFDASRLHAALTDIHRLAHPEVAGWDLVTLPPEERTLGLGRETLLRYFEGEGPGPEVAVDVARSGRNLRVTLANDGPFVTAVSNHGNWVQVTVDNGWLAARERGGFDRLAIGTASGDRWQEGDLDRVNGARFSEIYLGPGERVTSGSVRLPSNRTTVNVSWHLTLSDGSAITGEIER